MGNRQNALKLFTTLVVALLTCSLYSQDPAFSWEDTVITMIKNRLPDARYKNESIDLNDFTRLQLGLEIQKGQLCEIDLSENQGNSSSEIVTKLRLHIPLQSFDSRLFLRMLFKFSASVSLKVILDGVSRIGFDNRAFTVKTEVKLTWQEMNVSDDRVPRFIQELIKERVDIEVRRLLEDLDHDLEQKLNYEQDILIFEKSLGEVPVPLTKRFSIVGSWKGSSPFRPRHGDTGNSNLDNFVAAFVVRLLPDNRLQAVTDDYRLYALAQYILARYEVKQANYLYFDSVKEHWMTVTTNSDTLNTMIPRIEVIPTPRNGKIRMGGKLKNGKMHWLNLLKIAE